MPYLWLYLAIGLGFVVYGITKDQFSIAKQEVTYLRRGGKAPVTKETRQIGELLMQLTFYILCWPVFVVFALIFVPIHDYFADRAWRKYLAEHPEWPYGSKYYPRKP